MTRPPIAAAPATILATILILLLPGAGAAQGLSPEDLVRGLVRPAPLLRSAAPAPAPDPAQAAFLRRLPTRGLTIEARTELAEIAEALELPRIDVEIAFDFNSASLRPEALADLASIGQALTSDALASRRFVLAGHTDGVGSAGYNQTLSERRAAAVRDYLVTAWRIDPERLVAVGYGYERLRTPHDPYAAENRRVEILNLEVSLE